MRASNRFIRWTKKDSDAANKEGWNIWNCEGSADGTPQLCRNDEDAVFETDADAHIHVITKAIDGSELHRKALAILALENPAELAMI